MFLFPLFFFIFPLFLFFLQFFIFLIFLLILLILIGFFIFIRLSNNGIDIGLLVLLKVDFEVVGVDDTTRYGDLRWQTRWLYSHHGWIKHLVWQIIVAGDDDAPALAEFGEDGAALRTDGEVVHDGCDGAV